MFNRTQARTYQENMYLIYQWRPPWYHIILARTIRLLENNVKLLFRSSSPLLIALTELQLDYYIQSIITFKNNHCNVSRGRYKRSLSCEVHSESASTGISPSRRTSWTSRIGNRAKHASSCRPRLFGCVKLVPVNHWTIQGPKWSVRVGFCHTFHVRAGCYCFPWANSTSRLEIIALSCSHTFDPCRAPSPNHSQYWISLSQTTPNDLIDK